MISNVKKTPVVGALLVALSVTYGCDSNDNAISVVDPDDSGMQSGSTLTTTENSGGAVGGDAAVTEDSNNSNTSPSSGVTVDAEGGSGDNDATGETTGTGTSTEAPDEPASSGDPDAPTTNPESVTEFEAAYSARFVATWSAETHPTNFPADPHFSPLTGAVHNEQVVLWERGQNATDGIEEMAETGGTGPLLTEVQFAIDQGYASSAIEGGGIQVSPGSTAVDFVVNRDNPLVTLVSMLAPSPDWFIGVNSRSMIDDNGEFVDSLTVYLNLYDAGTDGGERFTSPDMNVPRSPIGLVNSFPFDSDFFEGRPHAGTLIFTRQR